MDNFESQRGSALIIQNKYLCGFEEKWKFYKVKMHTKHITNSIGIIFLFLTYYLTLTCWRWWFIKTINIVNILGTQKIKY